MKLSRLCSPFFLGLILIITLTGCARTPVGITKIPGQGRMGSRDVSSGAGPLASDSGLGGRDITGDVPLADPTSFDNMTEDPAALRSYTVHFEFDSSAIKPGEESKLRSVANQLKSKASTAVRIAGH